MEEKDIISIIMPCFNGIKYLNESLNSLLEQTNKNFEVVFIDDGSSDGSYEVAKKILSESELKFSLIKQKNSGVSIARNIGINIAKGKYLYFLDVDDTVEHDLIEKLLYKIKKSEFNIDAIFFGYNRIKNDKVVFSYTDNYKYLNKEKTNKVALREYLEQVSDIQTCTFIVKKSLLIDNNIFFREGCYYGEDSEFISKIIVNLQKFDVIEEELFHYCYRSDSAMNRFSINRFTGINAFEGLREYLEKLGLKDELKFVEKRLVKEIIGIHNGYAKYGKSSRNINVKLKEIVKKYKSYIKEFKYTNKNEKNINISCKIILINPMLYIKIIKLKNIIKGRRGK